MTTFYVAVCGECETFCSFHRPQRKRQLASLNAGHHDELYHTDAIRTHETARVESFESDDEFPERPPLPEFVELTPDDEEPPEAEA